MVTGNCLWAISIHKNLQGVVRISSSAQILAQRQSLETIQIIEVVGSSRQYTELLLDYFFYDERQLHDSKSDHCCYTLNPSLYLRRLR